MIVLGRAIVIRKDNLRCFELAIRVRILLVDASTCRTYPRRGTSAKRQTLTRCFCPGRRPYSSPPMANRTPGRARTRGHVPVEPPLPRGRLPPAERHLAQGQRQQTRRLQGHRRPRAQPRPQDTFERLPGVRPGAGGPRGLLPVRGRERHRRRTQQGRLSNR
jgi:hypothetical protein